MTRFAVELDPLAGRRSVYVIRDVMTAALVQHRTLEMPERFRSIEKARHRVAQLEEGHRRLLAELAMRK